jgi:predicted nucleic acid-binding protein
MSGEQAFLDTNVLLYAFNRADWRHPRAEELIVPLAVVSVQVLNEFVAAARVKLRLPWNEIIEALSIINGVLSEPRALTPEIHRAAVKMSATLGYHIYDSLIIASALDAGCTVLYSEDLQDGQVIGGLTIRNPFLANQPK